MTTALDDLSASDIMSPGHLGCAGCGVALSMRLALAALGRRTILVVPGGCWSMIGGAAPFSAPGVPLLHTPPSSAVATAAGVRAALDVKGETETTVCVWAGEDGAADGGVQALTEAAIRNENIIYVRCDSDPWLASGAQRPNDALAIVAAHRLAFAATATVAYPDDFVAKFQRARDTRGTRVLHILSACPPVWTIPPARAIACTRLAVAARVFPLVELIGGRHWRVTVDPPVEPLERYLEGQGRFSGLAADAGRIAAMHAALDERWADLTSKP